MKKFHVINNKIISLAAIRDITLVTSEKRLYLTYAVGDTRSEALQFTTKEEAEKAFADFAALLTQEV